MAGFRLIGKRWTIAKDPDAVLDYGVRLADWLPPGDSLPANPEPSWEVSEGLVIPRDPVSNELAVAYQDGVAFVLLSGGRRGVREWARCTWNTKGRRREQQTLHFVMTDN